MSQMLKCEPLGLLQQLVLQAGFLSFHQTNSVSVMKDIIIIISINSYKLKYCRVTVSEY